MSKLRRKSYNDPGHAHFLTFSCFRRVEIFADDHVCDMLAQSIIRARDLREMDLWAYVFMPDHVHLLVRPRKSEYSISVVQAETELPKNVSAISTFISDIGKSIAGTEQPKEPVFNLDGVLKIIMEQGGRTTQKEIRKKIPLSEAKISLMISELEAKGKVQKIKKGRGNIIVLK